MFLTNFDFPIAVHVSELHGFCRNAGIQIAEFAGAFPHVFCPERCWAPNGHPVTRPDVTVATQAPDSRSSVDEAADASNGREVDERPHTSSHTRTARTGEDPKQPLEDLRKRRSL